MCHCHIPRRLMVRIRLRSMERSSSSFRLFGTYTWCTRLYNSKIYNNTESISATGCYWCCCCCKKRIWNMSMSEQLIRNSSQSIFMYIFRFRLCCGYRSIKDDRNLGSSYCCTWHRVKKREAGNQRCKAVSTVICAGCWCVWQVLYWQELCGGGGARTDII